MPNVPNVPGVPPLPSYGANNVELLTGDAPDIAAGNNVLNPAWGIYYAGTASPVIIPATPWPQIVSGALAPIQDIAAPSLVGSGAPANFLPASASTAKFEYKQDWTIADYPIEQGGFQSYDKVQLPFDVRVRLNCSGPVAQRQAFLSTLDAMSNTTQLFDVHTPERTYANCSVSHIGFDREATAGAAMIQADIWFQQIRLTQAATFQNPQNPADTGQINSGTVQTSTLPPIPGSVVSSSPFLQAP